MIEVLPDMPEGVTGIRVSGRLFGDELRDFKPAMEEMLNTGEIRIVEVIASDYEGRARRAGRGPEAGLWRSLPASFGLQANRGSVR